MYVYYLLTKYERLFAKCEVSSHTGCGFFIRMAILIHAACACNTIK